MSAVTRPRGPLPSRVYWTRRLVLVAVVFALVFGVAHLLGGGGGGNGPSARPVGAEVSSSPTSASTSAVPTPAPVGTAPTLSSSPTATQSLAGNRAGTTAGKSPTATALPEPSGTCSVDDIVVAPSIKDQAHAGKPVTFAMQLTTKSTPACTFDVAPDSLVVKVTSGSDRIWSTQDCPKAVPTKSVVLRKDTPTTLDVTWSAMRSDSECSKATQWAQPGYYHAMAAVFGAEPVDDQFELLKPVRPTVTAKPSPSSKASAKAGAKASSKPSTKPSSKPSKKPAAKPSNKPSKKSR